MVSIRAANSYDAVAIARVHVESWRTTYAGIVPDDYLAGLDETLRVKLWQEWLSSGAVVLVAERKGGVVGFVHAGNIREAIETADAEVYSLYLLKESQGRGIGRALLTAARPFCNSADSAASPYGYSNETARETFMRSVAGGLRPPK
jgi:ribosomal protein S18 acetylase RimI-like enzyme